MNEPNALRVLILEDNNHDAELLLVRLRKAGYRLEAQQVSSAEAFRAALGDGPWDAILADYSMPRFTAPDALAILKGLEKDVPFLVVSGSVGEAAAALVMKAGAHDFFLKENLTRLPSAIERERGEARIRHERRQAIQELRESQERLRQAVRARDEFLSIASHELKTPLTSLTLELDSALQLLDAPTLAAGAHEKLASKLAGFSRQLSRMTTLINNLLEVTRITTGRLSLVPESVDLRASVDAAAVTMQESARRAGSTLTIAGATSVVGEWDALGVESVVVNLLSNAIKYGSGKPIEIEVDSVAKQARLVVTDHGIGIRPAEQERIFHRFERAVPEHHYGGFGLGLWVAREIVEAHGGTIAVASKPDCGSIFTVLLPLEPGKGSS